MANSKKTAQSKSSKAAASNTRAGSGSDTLNTAIDAFKTAQNIGKQVKKRTGSSVFAVLVVLAILAVAGYFVYKNVQSVPDNNKQLQNTAFDEKLSELKEQLKVENYNGDAYIAVNDNIPFFTSEELTTTCFETYGDLDSLKRCTSCMACVGKELMPTEKRGDISSVKPTGWQSTKYDSSLVEGGYLYNRCHLIGYQLGGNAGDVEGSKKDGYDKTTWKRNLITGTRYLNIDGMLLFEDMVADAVKENNIHVMYRVTPLFRGDNLVADGVLMEGWSVEDNGETICFCVFSYNVQPGITIDYKTGKSALQRDAH